MSPIADYGDTLDDVLTAAEVDAAAVLRASLGVDVTRTYQFWEAVVARLLEGALTPRGCPWDIELQVVEDERPARAEVKFSGEFACAFTQGARQVFKWASPRGEGTTKGSDVTALIGLDDTDRVHAWIAPSSALRRSTSITLTTPRTRTGHNGRSEVEQYRVPFLQLLPEVLRSWGEHIEEATGA